MKNKLYVERPNICNRERFLQCVNEILDRRWLSNNGPVVQEGREKNCRLSSSKNMFAFGHFENTMAFRVSIC
jgi:hypothetical protein